MTMDQGGVTIDPNTGAEHFSGTHGLAEALYQSRKSAQRVADTTKPRASLVMKDALIGDSSVTVDQTVGWHVGDTFGTFNYTVIDPLTGKGTGATVTINVLSLTATLIVLTASLPVAIPQGTQVGFQGTAADWATQMLPVMIKQRTDLALTCNADGAALVGYLVPHLVVDLSGVTANVAAGGGAQNAPLVGTVRIS